ncbi:putative ABC transporter ATP-binding protein [Phycisphaerae bacterium RAS2]|nr:putative ABC transporter ATP-binding protein [Phycisphaerae bacterium RAS2]
MTTDSGNHSETIIELRGVSKRFGALTVLDGVNLSIARGKTTVVIGESGTGKSVLLKHLVALLRPDSGEVHFHGRRIDDLSEQELVESRKRFGFLFQMGALFDSMTVAENVAFPIIQHGDQNLAPNDLDELVAQKLRMVGLDGLQSRRPGELSGGQKKRVALARAIALSPEVVLYDEPTTGLDPVRADVINELIIKLNRELNVTSLVVTHDMTSAYKVADRIIMLHHGKIIADADATWFKSCDDRRVRRFVDGKADEQDLKALDM